MKKIIKSIATVVLFLCSMTVFAGSTCCNDGQVKACCKNHGKCCD